MKLINMIDIEDYACDCDERTPIQEFVFKPITRTSDDEIVGFAKMQYCKDCGESEIVEIFTNGDIRLEFIAQYLGTRNEDSDDEYVGSFELDGKILD